MQRYTLLEYLGGDGNTQTSLADAVGVSQGAISQAVKAVKEGKKQVYVVVSDSSVLLESVKIKRREAAA